MTKVGKSDAKGTFTRTPGNDKVAPIPDLPVLVRERGGSFRSRRLLPEKYRPPATPSGHWNGFSKLLVGYTCDRRVLRTWGRKPPSKSRIKAPYDLSDRSWRQGQPAGHPTRLRIAGNLR